MDKLSYGLGTILATNLTQQGFESLSSDDFMKGFQAILNGEKTEISIEEANNLVQAKVTELTAAKKAMDNAAAEKFLMENATKKGVTVLPSGLQYEVITAGVGPKPTAADQVTTHYEGKLLDGSIFDSSVQRGTPATFPVNGVIAGWVEALQLMNTGSKWRLFVPSHLAYGERGAGQMIGPNATLIFEVELISIV